MTYWLTGGTAAAGLFTGVVLHELGHAMREPEDGSGQPVAAVIRVPRPTGRGTCAGLRATIVLIKVLRSPARAIPAPSLV